MRVVLRKHRQLQISALRHLKPQRPKKREKNLNESFGWIFFLWRPGHIHWWQRHFQTQFPIQFVAISRFVLKPKNFVKELNFGWTFTHKFSLLTNWQRYVIKNEGRNLISLGMLCICRDMISQHLDERELSCNEL